MKRILSIVTILVICLAMIVGVASAATAPDLDMDYYHYNSTFTSQFKNTAYFSGSGSSSCNYLQVNMTLIKEVTQEILFDNSVVEGESEDYNLIDWNVSVLYTDYDYNLPKVNIVNDGRAIAYFNFFDTPFVASRVEYIDLDAQINGTSRSANYNISAANASTKYSSIIGVDARNKGVAAGEAIAAEFKNVPEDYRVYYHSEIEDVIGTVNYLFIKENLYLCNGDKVPTYFLSPDGNTIIAVKKDKEDSKYSRTFVKNELSEWEVCGDFSIITPEASSNSATLNETVDITSEMVEIPGDYTYTTSDKLRDYLGSVETYLSIRKMLGGGKIEAYYISEDENSIVAISRNGLGEICKNFLKFNENGQWARLEN